MAKLIFIDDERKTSIEFNHTGHIDSVVNEIRGLLIAHGYATRTVDTHVLCEMNDYGAEFLDVEVKDETP